MVYYSLNPTSSDGKAEEPRSRPNRARGEGQEGKCLAKSSEKVLPACRRGPSTGSDFKMLFLLGLSLVVILQVGDGAFHLNITEGCKLIFPPWDGGIRYRGLTREQVKMARFLPFDYEIEYVCRPEREIVGPKVRKCLPNGTWTNSDVESRCLRTCPKMHLSLENGQAHARALERVPVEGTWVEYRCNSGFHLVGSPHSNCTKAGRWSTAKPVCELWRPSVSRNGSDT